MNERAWWVLVGAFCLGCVLIITLAWKHELGSIPPRPGQVVDQESVDSVVGEYLSRSRSKDPPIFVPTGIFIQSVQFANSNDVNITGFVWQKYADTISEEVSRGFLFPEQVSSAETVVEEIFRREAEGYEVIGWYFDVTVRHTFDYSRYPLDRHDVWLRLWHHDFDRKVLLIPDLTAYNSVGTFGSFGIDRALVSGGWQIIGTWFGYKPARYDTNFGIVDYVGQRNFPELYFHLVMVRSFINALVVDLVPLLVVAVFLFSVLMSMTTDEEQSERFGFDMLAVVGSASALLFVLITAHIQLRYEFPGSRISYMEYFYLVMYFVIMLVGINGYLSTYSSAPKIPRYYHFFSKLAYWPLLLGSLTVITLMVF